MFPHSNTIFSNVMILSNHPTFIFFIWLAYEGPSFSFSKSNSKSSLWIKASKSLSTNSLSLSRSLLTHSKNDLILWNKCHTLEVSFHAYSIIWNLSDLLLVIYYFSSLRLERLSNLWGVLEVEISYVGVHIASGAINKGPWFIESSSSLFLLSVSYFFLVVG